MPLNVETPPIDPIFSLDCLKLNEMKGLFKTIFEYLKAMGDKLDAVPDFSDLQRRLGKLERDHASLKGDVNLKIGTLTTNAEKLEAFTNQSLDNHEKRITKLEELVKEFDINKIFERDEFKMLIRRVEQCEKNIFENSDRVLKLEVSVRDELKPDIKRIWEKIAELEAADERMNMDIKIKVGKDEMEQRLDEKADVGALDYLRESIEKLNELVNDFMN